MIKTVVHLVRHGEVHNPNGILYGRLPGFPLSERGSKQALVTAEYLADRDITHVVSSPLERARQTAAPIAASHRIDVAIDDQLTEASSLFEGKRMSTAGHVFRDPQNWLKLRNPFRPSWGEPYLEIARRMLSAVHDARSLAAGHEVVCVSHQQPIWMLRRFCEGHRLWHDPRRRECSYASVTTLEFIDEQLVKILYHDPVSATNTRTPEGRNVAR